MALMSLQSRFIAFLLVGAAFSSVPLLVFAQFVPGLEYSNQPALATVNILPAYNAGLSGAGVRLGLVDSGINPNHLEFANAIVAGFDSVSGRSGTSDFPSFLHDNPVYGNHGSFTSSVAAGRLDGAARADNLQGVAYNAGIVIGTMDVAPGYFDRMAAALNYVSGQSVRVINNSWDTVEHIGNPALDYQTLVHDGPQLISAIKTVLDRGSVIVFTTGNNGALTPATPAVLPSFDAEIAAKGGFIVVGASTIDGTQLAGYSNRCGITKAYCIVAPGGTGIESQPPAEQGILGVDGATHSSYYNQAGTSVAAPIVSGAVALVAEQFPWMTNKNLATTILTTASRAANPDDEWGRGLLNIGKAINGPAIFEEDFAANVSSGYASTFSNNISGTAGLLKLGAGTLILSGSNTYSGDTHLDGGDLVANSQANLGSSGSALQFNGGTLKFGADFALNRDLLIGAVGGTLHLNGYNKTQSSNISGSGQFAVTGAGSYTLDRVNSQQGGIAVRGGSQVHAQRDDYLGAAGSKVSLDDGRLNLLNNFVVAEAGIFNRPLEIGPGNGVLDTGNNTLRYTGGEISGAGTLSFIGGPFTLGSDLTLNGTWNADLRIPATLTLRGNGRVNGDLTIAGTLSPGNSPGTLTAVGPVVNLPSSSFVVEIDGVGTGIGAGNHDRLLLTGASSSYTAGGSLNPLLRGISGAASNTYQPAVGRGFEFVSAPGGVLGEFSTFTQPSAGLLPGTRMDLVYGKTALTLYATPASYADIGAAGVPNSVNRQQLGAILEEIRPAPGIRESKATTKRLFDSLAPQSQSSLPISMDQLGGVGYAQLIGMHFENTQFLTEQTIAAVGSQRRGEGPQLAGPAASDLAGNAAERLWTLALGRSSRWAGDSSAYGMTDALGVLMGGVQKHLDAQTLAGVSIAYASSHPQVDHNIGNGPTQSLQLTAYASRAFDSGFFVQGAVGGGAGRIEAKRTVAMLGSPYEASIDTTNLNVSALTGWARGERDSVRYETSFGLNYLALHSFGFKDSTSDAFGEISVKAQNQESMSATLSTRVSVPFQAKGIDWRGSMLAGLTHAFADTITTLDVNILERAYSIESGAIGRNRLNLGLALSGDLTQRARIGFDLSRQTARHWHATTVSLWLNLAF